MTVLAYIAFGYLVMRILVALTNVLGSSKLPRLKEALQDEPKISILVPARNEEKNIPRLIEGIRAQNYKKIELLIYDDLSTDNTAKHIQDFEKKDHRIQLLKGQQLPEGWTGKNHACYQLGNSATGEIFVFLDADVKVGNNLFSQVVSYMKTQKVSLLSIFPKQDILSSGEWTTVPLMNWILLSLLPVPLSNKIKVSSLSAANGQFMAFDKENYKQNQWHKLHKSDWVEDINIMRSVRSSGFKTALFLGNGGLTCRMYSSRSEGIAGFTRNLAHFYGNNYALLLFSNFLVIFGLPLSYLFIDTIAASFYFLGIIILKTLTSLASYQSIMRNIIYHPLQLISLLTISIHSFIHRKTKKLSWKDRKLLS